MRADVTIHIPNTYFHQMVKGWAMWSAEQRAQYRRRHVKQMERHFAAPGIRPSITLVEGDELMVRMDVSKLPPVIQEHFRKKAPK